MAELNLAKSSQRLAYMALEIEYNGKTLKEWIDLIAGGECISVPGNATNGDVIKAICPMWINYHDTDVELIINNKEWNAPYNGGKT